MPEQRSVERIVFSTDDCGLPITITYPSPLRAHELNDMRELMEIFYRSQERRSGTKENGNV